MPIEFRCMMCGQRLRVADEYRGQRARCSNCETILDVPNDQRGQAIVLSAEKADVIDYELFGDESQYVEITLDPGEMAISRAENMIYMAAAIRMNEVDQQLDEVDRGLIDMITKASKRILTRDRVELHAFCNVGQRREIVAFAPKSPSRLVPMQMDELGGQVVCKNTSVLCVARGIEIRDVGEPELLDSLRFQRLVGNGVAVLQFPGGIMHRVLTRNQTLHVRSNALVAMTDEIRIAVHLDDDQGEEPSLLTVTGPGEFWLRTTA